MVYVFDLIFSIFVCNRYETISLRDDFIGQRQTVHSHSRSPFMCSLIWAYLCKKETTIAVTKG